MSSLRYKLRSKTIERTFVSKLEKLIKHRRRDEVKSIVKRFLSRISSSKSAIHNYGATLVRLAKKYNNFKLIDFLVNSGCEVNGEDSFAVTELLSTLFSHHYLDGSVESFMDANAVNFHTIDAECVLRVLITNMVTLDATILSVFMKKLAMFSQDLESMANLMVKVNCPLKLVICTSEEHLTKMVLENSNYMIDDDQYVAAIQYVMEKIDLANLRVLWRSDRAAAPRKITCQRLSAIIKEHSLNWDSLVLLFYHLLDWMVYDHDFLVFIRAIFLTADQYGIHVLLHQCNVDKKLKKEYGLDVLPIVFGNLSLNIDNLTKLTCVRQFYVNSKSINGRMALHFAALKDSASRIELLIEMGANCNAKDDLGLTPLCYTDNAECTLLLLKSGANLHITDFNNRTVFEKKRYSKGAWEAMLAQLAVDRSRGVKLRKSIIEKIYSQLSYRNYYGACLVQIKDIMKGLYVPKNMTLFTIMTKKAKYLVRLLYDTETIFSTVSWSYRKQLINEYFYQSVQLNLERACNIYQSKCLLATIISKQVSIPVDWNHLVIDRIIEFLSYRDMHIFASV